MPVPAVIRSAGAPAYDLISSRARTILRADWPSPPAGVLQFRAISTSEAYILYDLGPRKGFACIWFKGPEEGRSRYRSGEAGYIAALDDFCAAAFMPPLDSRQRVDVTQQ